MAALKMRVSGAYIVVGGPRGPKGNSAYTPIIVDTAQTITLVTADTGKSYLCTHPTGNVIFEVEDTVDDGSEFSMAKLGGALGAVRVISNSLDLNLENNGDVTIVSTIGGVYVQKNDGAVFVIGSWRFT